MTNEKQKITIDEYILKYPQDVQNTLQNIRKTIKKVLPDAEETMSYGMPTFDLNNHHLIYFSAWNDHIGVYPLYTDGGELKDDFAPYKQDKNAMHFPLTEPFPYDVIEKFALFRVKEEAKK